MNKKEYSGYIGDLSTSQEQALEKFRAEVRAMDIPDDKYDDVYLLRFLRARKFDLAKTKEMWVNFIKWRKENGVDQIKDFVFTEIEEVKKSWPHGYFMTDKEGRPIYIERTGILNLTQLFKVTTEERMIKYWIQGYERVTTEILPACSKIKGSHVGQTLAIIDLKGFSMGMMSKKVYNFIQLASNIGQNYYPEIMGRMLVINAPMLFSGIWSMIKGWIDEKTRAKIEIIGSKYEAKLLELVPAENLPDFLGGKATKSEYGENMTIEKGPWVKVIAEEKAKKIAEKKALEDQEERKIDTQDAVTDEMRSMGISEGYQKSTGDSTQTLHIDPTQSITDSSTVSQR
mmetsp:Transcript_66689/g.77405  ORF Transcript_66689/g.77405 Transcript_66689/m.77405 type:complete len:343 (-) Transcript_66689:184-1212(-)